jgi:hypothetical protein
MSERPPDGSKGVRPTLVRRRPTCGQTWVLPPHPDLVRVCRDGGDFLYTGDGG